MKFHCTAYYNTFTLGYDKASGGAMSVDPRDNDKIMHAILTGEHVELMISDYPSYWENIPTSWSDVFGSVTDKFEST